MLIQALKSSDREVKRRSGQKAQVITVDASLPMAPDNIDQRIHGKIYY